MFIKELATPETFATTFGAATLTHEGFEYVISAKGQGFIKTSSWKGIVNANGEFVPLEETRKEYLASGPDLAVILKASGGKKKNDFRLSDIKDAVRLDKQGD